jgi:hypothetical protein
VLPPLPVPSRTPLKKRPPNDYQGTPTPRILCDCSSV